MTRKIPKKVIDITGIELTPGEPNVCLGNGDQGLECCCDECDYFLLCFPEYKPQWIKDLYDETTDEIIEEKKIDDDHQVSDEEISDKIPCRQENCK